MLRLTDYISEEEKKILEETKEILQEKLDIDFSKIKVEQAFNYLVEKFEETMRMLGHKLDFKHVVKLEYYIYRDFIGLGKLDPILNDPNIEDISCDGANIPIFVYHRNPLYGGLQTNVVFKTREGLDNFVLKLAQKCGRTLSIAEPLLDGALPEGSRVQATYGTDIAMRGSNFTIRKFTKDPLTPVDLMKSGTATPEIFAYLWMLIENNMSVMIAGATATGKTSFLNAMSLFIKPEFKIVSIEDTPELRLPHPNWIPEVARAGFSKEGYGEVSMFDLLKASLRQRPNYIIVGEVRGKEAVVMFQGMSTGHPSMGTLHADSVEAVVARLTNKPISLPIVMLENLDAVCFLNLNQEEGKYVRRVSEIVEIAGYDYTAQKLRSVKSWIWNATERRYENLSSVILKRVSSKKGVSVEIIREDLQNRVRVLRWLLLNNIRRYTDVAKYIKMYYVNPDYLLKIVEQGAMSA